MRNLGAAHGPTLDEISEIGRKAIHEMAEKARATDCTRVIISAEDFSVLDADSIHRLVALLEPYFHVTDVLCALRRQDQYALSNLSTEYKTGAIEPASLLFLKTGRRFRLNFDEVLRDWEALLGRNVLSVWLHDSAVKSDGGVIGEFCRRAKIQWNPLFRIPDKENKSIDSVSQRVLAKVNAWAAKKNESWASEFRLRLCWQLDRAESGKGWMPSAKTAKKLTSNYKASNERVRRKYFPETPRPLFGADYSAYPQRADAELEPTFTEILDLIAESQRPRRDDEENVLDPQQRLATGMLAGFEDLAWVSCNGLTEIDNFGDPYGIEITFNQPIEPKAWFTVFMLGNADNRTCRAALFSNALTGEVAFHIDPDTPQAIVLASTLNASAKNQPIKIKIALDPEIGVLAMTVDSASSVFSGGDPSTLRLGSKHAGTHADFRFGLGPHTEFRCSSFRIGFRAISDTHRQVVQSISASD